MRSIRNLRRSRLQVAALSSVDLEHRQENPVALVLATLQSPSTMGEPAQLLCQAV